MTLLSLTNHLHTVSIETPLGSMIAIARTDALLMLQFTDKVRLQNEIKQIENSTQLSILPIKNAILDSIENELTFYFRGELKVFNTPLQLIGTPFQHRVWHALSNIPYGKTKSYTEEAHDIHHPSAYRAVANANGANHLSIVIPCHRVISHSGELGGYSSGIYRKKWLLDHEQRHNNQQRI